MRLIVWYLTLTMHNKKGLSQFDAEGVIGLSSPYKCTAERSSATKKPHKNEEIRRIFLGGFQHFYQIATKLNEIWVVSFAWLLFCAK